jgi:formate dehydrogenase major subunit
MPLQDLANADVVWIQGSGMAEAHPVGFRWVMKAKERGAKVVHVDPRFSRTSALADEHIAIRAGADIAFLGGLIHQVLERDAYFKDYVLNYTNATTVINDDYVDAEDNEGLFSGYNPETGAYDPTTWSYKGGQIAASAGVREHTAMSFTERTGAGMMTGQVERDPTLQNPRCVLNILKRHYQRYTPDVVSQITGVSEEQLLAFADLLIENSGRDKTTALVYAVGWTQHTAGVQMIRAGSILQLLLGNMGRPGGGILAARGHASIQGSTDIPTLFDILPGYLHMPKAREGHFTLKDYVDTGGADKGWWSNFDKYIVSLLKAWWGHAATKDNDFCFDYLPKITGVHAHFPTVLRMMDGGLEGYFVMGQNPAAGSMHAGLQRRALTKLKWLVVRDLAEIETATFWRDSPEVQSGEFRTEDLQTEVFLMPAATHIEKEGTFTQTQRLLQWRDKALEAPGDARSELWFMHHLTKRIKQKLADSDDPRDKPIQHLTWDYPEHGDRAEPSAEAVLREINGYVVDGGAPVPGFADLKSDGSTACGCWIYSGVYKDGVNQARRRTPSDETISPEWGWAWPANRRILYNRASADPSGKPWSERKKLIEWSEEEGKWIGPDVPDFPVGKHPDYRGDEDSKGMDAIGGADPFMMMADGKAWLFAPSGLVDGPLPTHYEPLESPLPNPLYDQLHENPAALRWNRPDNPTTAPGDERYPCVLTTFRLTEHHTAGGMSRYLPWLAELQPEMFAEIDPVLAAKRGIEDGEWMTVTTERAEINARALVSPRMKPLQVGGKTVHQVALPFHWSYGGTTEAKGDAANDLITLSGDPNVAIQESKAFVCDVRAGQTSTGTKKLSGVEPLKPYLPNEDHPAEERPQA